MISVYGLYAGPATEPFYVGVTATPTRRLWAHKAAAKGDRRDSITGCGVDPASIRMSVFATHTEREVAEQQERDLIQQFGIAVINKQRYRRVK